MTPGLLKVSGLIYNKGGFLSMMLCFPLDLYTLSSFPSAKVFLNMINRPLIVVMWFIMINGLGLAKVFLYSKICGEFSP